MFRRLKSSLPEDPTFPADLEKLGYFITSDDHIKSIEFPADYFRFWITNNERYNDVQREAMHTCIRKEVIARLTALNLHPLYLPSLTTTKPKCTRHLPIMCTPLPTLRQKPRVIVLMNRLLEDLAILSYRVLSKDGGINQGSATSFIHEVLARSPADAQTPGIIILNPGQLLYSYRLGTAVTPTSWDAMPRKSAVHPMPNAHPQMNHVPENTTAEEHIAFVFDHILCDDAYVRKNAEIYLVGLGDGGDELVKFLDKNWPKYSTALNLTALALTAPLRIEPSTAHISLSNTAFLDFLATRARAWAVSDEPLNTPLADATDFFSLSSSNTAVPVPVHEVSASVPAPSNEASAAQVDGDGDGRWGWQEEEAGEPAIQLCDIVSGGEAEYAECVFPAAYKAILDWFDEVAVAVAVAATEGVEIGRVGRE